MNVDHSLPLRQQIQPEDARVMYVGQTELVINCVLSNWRDASPCILVHSRVTMVIHSLVGLQPHGLGPSVPGRVPGWTSTMVDPVSTRALHRVLLRVQSKYSSFVWPRRPRRHCHFATGLRGAGARQ